MKEFTEHMKTQCPSLSYIQDIANGTKHGNISKYIPMVKTTAYHSGAFSSGFSTGFDIPSLRMVLDNNQVVYFDKEVINSMAFLDNYFNNN
jgi:DNA helicase IV